MRPRFRHGEAVRIVRQPDGARSALGDGTVEDVVGPREGGGGWAVAVRIGEALWVLPEDDLEGAAAQAEPPPELTDTLQLRLVTDLVDGVQAARVAERIDDEVRRVAGPVILAIEAERHWAEPYPYELDVAVRPLGDVVEALHALVRAGGGGWISCRDDGWRCDLWWDAGDGEGGYLVPEVRGAELTLLPWSSAAVRPESERPLVSLSPDAR
jgi:hypothetical protein